MNLIAKRGKMMLKRFVLFGRRVSTYWESVSFREAVYFACLDFASTTREIELTWPGYASPISLRAGTSDIQTFCHVIAGDGYEQELASQPSVIVDAGAHIGLASLWYANRYPEAKVIALEPDPENYELLLRNTKAYDNIVPLNVALWNSSGTVALTDRQEGSWAFQVRRPEEASASDRSVPSICVADLMRSFNLDHIDVLKVDIEGSEKEVFEDCAEWVHRVSAIAIELHDRFKSGCSRAFYAATTRFADEVMRNEDTFVRREPPIRQIRLDSHNIGDGPAISRARAGEVRPTHLRASHPR
jgi:FkbM family methyltransferase